MNYGHFDDERREYIITNPRTPVKWINYVGTLAFGGFVDHTGGSLICKGDPTLNRITKYISQLPASEFKGETLYLRLNTLTPTPSAASPDQGEGRRGEGYQIFSPYFVPTLGSYERYECRIGLGYTRIVSEFYGVRTDAAIFVPPGEDRLIRDTKITNLADQPISIDAIPVVEYTHFDALKQFTNADWVPQTMQSRAQRGPRGTLVLTQYAFMRRDTIVNYFTSNLPVSSFESDRRRFLGDDEYGTWVNPLALHSEELSNTEAQRGDNIGALLHHLGVLQPGETRRLITQLGQAESVAAALPSIQTYRDEKKVDWALQQMADWWADTLSKQQVETPDADLNRMVNIHNPRQCTITKQWSRYLSLYQLGLGTRGIGFRDSAQDVMGILPLVPHEAKDLTRQLLSVQKRDGSAMHQFNPLTLVASEGDSLEREDRPHYYSDDHLWIVLAVAAYLKETGDLAFLDQMIPYYEKNRDGAPVESGAVLDHLQRAIEFTRGDLGVHGLPLLGFADWNDTLNLPAGAESLFTANLYGTALREMIELARQLGDREWVEQYTRDYDTMKQRVNAHAWDGEWYVRYFDFDGQPLGSRRNRHGQIYLNGQTWPVISGFATPERARLALDSAYRLLNTRNGIKLSRPGFDGFDPAKGGITTYPPGAKENGGIFVHTNPWAMIAETMLGDGDRAYEYYAQINPAAKNNRIEEYECEPYVYPQNILGDEHPQFGLARNSWLTGAASWAYQAATNYILGIRPTYTGLMIDPCLPRAWVGFKMTRRFRNACYAIEVENPDPVCQGVKALVVDGAHIEGNLVPIFDDGRTHRVIVVMGLKQSTNLHESPRI